MQIWLKGYKKIRIPVLPSEYKVTSNQNNTTVNVIGKGEVVLKGKPGLREISFSSFFPKRYDSSYCDVTPKSPKTYVDNIEKLKKKGSVKLIITGTSINFRCTIESFEWGEQDGTGDIYYTLTLKEYKGVSASSSAVVQMEG